MRWLRILGWTIGGLVVLVGVLFAGLQTPPGKALVAAFVSSDDIRIEGVSGFIPVDLRVATVEMRDKKGVWLNVSDARVTWSFTSLFSGRVRIEQILANKVSPFKVTALVVNLAIVIYLLLAKRLFGLRGGVAADEQERRRDTGWPSLAQSAPEAVAESRSSSG